MRLTTWNVNGIRNPFSYPPWNQARTFPAMFDILSTDIVVMQELKIQRKDLRDDMVLLDGWDCYFSLPKHKKGYSGVGIYTRNATCAPIRAEEGLLGVLPSPNGLAYCDLPEGESVGGYPDARQVEELGVDPQALDAEGRCLVLEFPAFVLFGVYSPANSNGLRDDFRYGFICALDCRIRNLAKMGKRVVLVGDLNVSRDEMDGANVCDEMKKLGMSHEQYISTPNRRIFNQLLVGGEVFGERDEGREEGVLWDTTRAFHPERKGMFTHWEQKVNARPGNFGSRIDFVLVSKAMQTWVKDANIQEGLLGSDHCPVYADFHDEVLEGAEDDQKRKLIDIMNPPGTFVDGVKQRDWKVSTVPAFSGKRLEEFNKRRSIKSMFAAPAVKKTESSKQKTPDPPQTNGNAETTERVKEAATANSEAPQTTQVPALPPSKGTDSPQSQSGRSDRVSPVKRKSPAATKAPPPNKRQKSEPKPTNSKSQQSLKGFFQAKQPSKPATDAAAETAPEDPAPALTSANSNTTSPYFGTRTLSPQTPSTQPPATPPSKPSQDTKASPSPSPRSALNSLANAEKSQKSWSTLFARPVAPLCEDHNEPCKMMQTKKKGSNQGRSFWMCARPLGPNGEKQRGTDWRCGTFVWASDWGLDGKGARGVGMSNGAAEGESGGDGEVLKGSNVEDEAGALTAKKEVDGEDAVPG
ncbi:hypothetical protein MBLNU230_g6769t1 [Neophaeotheca triangularis]